jgi:hypothetical protein
MGHRMVNSVSAPASPIDAQAAMFCFRLTQACAEDVQKAYHQWAASDRVDNPDPLGWHDAARSLGQLPQRTFRYGAPAFQCSRPTLAFAVSRNRSSSFRTPVEQAAEVAANRSWVCWGGHMSNMARHVIPRVNGRSFTDGDAFERQLGANLSWFVALWESTLRSCGLHDASGGQHWFKKDQLHIELPGAKISQTDSRATACVVEYVRLVNAGRGRRNLKFEHACHPGLAAHLRGLVR